MISTDYESVTYQGDGVTTAFTFTFPVDDADDVKVKIIDSDGNETVLTSDYYADSSDGTLYYPGYESGEESADPPATLAEGEYITIYRETPVTQESDLGEKWPFYTIEDGLDKLTMILQEQEDTLASSVNGISASGTTLTITTNDGTTSTVTTQDTTYTFTTGSTNGTIAVDGTDIAVAGLGTAAYTDSTDYLAANGTAAQATADADGNEIASTYATAASLSTAVTSLSVSDATISYGMYDGTSSTLTVNNVANATSATQDGDGNTITSTYAKSADLATVATTGSYNDLSDTPSLATVATTGAYSDLTDTPSLATVATSGLYSDLSGTPSLATVATSGSYNDLSDTPTIPTNVSDLNNDSGFITSSGSITGNAATATLATTATTANGLAHSLTINDTAFDGTADVTMTISGGGVTEYTSAEVDTVWNTVWA